MPDPRPPRKDPRGRKPLDPTEPTVNYTIRLPASWRDTIVEHNLLPEVRAAIERLVRRASR